MFRSPPFWATFRLHLRRIQRSIDLRAPRARVWRALADTTEFGRWFGVNLAGHAFVPGKQVRGHITHPGYEHLQFAALVERVDAAHRKFAIGIVIYASQRVGVPVESVRLRMADGEVVTFDEQRARNFTPPV